MDGKKRAINRLSFPQQFQLAEALKTDAARFDGEQPDLDGLAREFSDRLGFPLTGSNVQTALAAAGITWESRRNRTGPGSPRYTRTRVLHAVREAVVGLLETSGRPVPADLLLTIEEAGQEFARVPR